MVSLQFWEPVVLAWHGVVLRTRLDLLRHEQCLADAVVDVDAVEIATRSADTEDPIRHVIEVSIGTPLLRFERQRIVLSVSVSRDFHSDKCGR